MVADAANCTLASAMLLQTISAATTGRPKHKHRRGNEDEGDRGGR